MSRICRVRNWLNPVRTARIAVFLAGLFFASSAFSVGATVYPAPTLRIAVAPFAGESVGREKSALFVAKALAARLAHSNIERVIAPGEFVATPIFEPRASQVRRWAYNSAVDTIVVGRVSSMGKDGPRVVETVVRSGHSGAELSRHEVLVPRDGNLDRSVERLAAAILEGLGHVEPRVDERQAQIPASAGSASPDAGQPPDSEAGSSGSGLDLALSESEFSGDAPIEIKADEAEIINRNEGRKLIFQKNVWVHQDNVTLRSDRLEASYRKGESEPRELIAEGQVRIVQDDRRAKCDRAVYLREANRLTCTGRAELVQGCDVIRGESIEFDLAGNQARVAGAASIVIQPKGAVPTDCTKSRGQM